MHHSNCVKLIGVFCYPLIHRKFSIIPSALNMLGSCFPLVAFLYIYTAVLNEGKYKKKFDFVLSSCLFPNSKKEQIKHYSTLYAKTGLSCFIIIFRCGVLLITRMNANTTMNFENCIALNLRLHSLMITPCGFINLY